MYFKYSLLPISPNIPERLKNTQTSSTYKLMQNITSYNKRTNIRGEKIQSSKLNNKSTLGHLPRRLSRKIKLSLSLCSDLDTELGRRVSKLSRTDGLVICSA